MAGQPVSSDSLRGVTYTPQWRLTDSHSLLTGMTVEAGSTDDYRILLTSQIAPNSNRPIVILPEAGLSNPTTFP